MASKIILWIFLMAFFMVFSLPASVIRVPGAQPTIQAGIGAASTGDTVLVAPGIYFENINFKGKNITVASHYILTGDTALIGTTVINGSKPAHPDTASCVRIVSGEDSTAILEGFTLTGGTGTRWIDEHGAGTFFEGGGILITRSSPTIKHNRIVDNEAIRIAPGVTSAGGGGIRVGDGSPRILANLIKNNKGMYGAGIVLNFAHALVRGNIIVNNTVYQAVANIPTFGGGGIWIYSTGPHLIENNTIVGNSATGTGSTTAGRGGAIMVNAAPTVIQNNIIWQNSQAVSGQLYLAGIETTVMYNDIQGGFSGVGNINAEPLFADSEYNLSASSPCVDTGNPASPLDPDGTRADMGARVFFHLTHPYFHLIDYQIDDQLADGDGQAEAGETIRLSVTLGNTSQAANGIISRLTTTDPDLQVSQELFLINHLGRDQNQGNRHEPFVFTISNAAIKHRASFYLHITAEGGYSQTDSLALLVGSSNILLIDDDAGKDYERYFTRALEKNLRFADHWDVNANGVPALDLLRAYQAVIWFTGDDRETTLSPAEQLVLANYLSHGGRLLLTGQDIGYDLIRTGTPADSAFFHQYLHVDFSADSSGRTIVMGLAGDPVGNGVVLNFIGTQGGAHNQKAPDVITAIAPATIFLQYFPGTSGAGARSEDMTSGSRIIYLGFGFEGIAGPKIDSASKLLEQLLVWLLESTPVKVNSQQSAVADGFELHQNYPNPFNPCTQISYSLAKDCMATLKIYDVTGREVVTLVHEQKRAGAYQVTLSAQDMAAGVYFYQLTADGYRMTRKFIILR